MVVIGEKAGLFQEQIRNFWLNFTRLLVLGIFLVILQGCQLQERSNDAGVMHLTLWHGVNPPHNRDVLQDLVDRFNREHSDIQVNSLYVGQEDQQMPKILASIVGNVPPDMLWFNPTITGQLVELNAIRSLDDLLAASPLKDEIDPVLFASMQLFDHIWSVPFGTNNAGIFYRPSLFEAAGITQLPTTWEELRQVAKTLTRDTDSDGRVDQYGMLLPLGKGEWTVFMWLPFMWSGGGELIAEDGKTENAAIWTRGDAFSEKFPTSGASPVPLASSYRIAFKDSRPSRWGEREIRRWGQTESTSMSRNLVSSVNLVNQGAIAALQFWRDLIEDGSGVLSSPERGYEMNRFLTGKVAMQLSGPWTLGELQATGVDFGVLPMPTQVRQTTVIGGENLFLFKTTPEREQAAFKFAEYVLGEEFQTQWAIKTGYLPVNLRARQSEVYQTFVEQQSAVKVFVQQAEYGRSRPIFRGYNRISENLGRAIESVLLGKSSPKEALKTAQRRLELIFR